VGALWHAESQWPGAGVVKENRGFLNWLSTCAAHTSILRLSSRRQRERGYEHDATPYTLSLSKGGLASAIPLNWGSVRCAHAARASFASRAHGVRYGRSGDNPECTTLVWFDLAGAGRAPARTNH